MSVVSSKATRAESTYFDYSTMENHNVDPLVQMYSIRVSKNISETTVTIAFLYNKIVIFRVHCKHSDQKLEFARNYSCLFRVYHIQL